MSESIDFRINDYIYEYLDYKGYTNTVETFLRERVNRKEPVNKTTQKNLSDKDKEKYKTIKEEFLKHLDNGNREEFFHLWYEHIPSDIVDNDPSLKSLEFLFYTHFAIYYLRPNTPNRNEHLAQDNMQVFKTYIESIKGQNIAQTSDILPLFALPYVSSPDKHTSFQDLFSDQWSIQLRLKAANFFDWIFSSRPLPKLVKFLENGERASHLLTQLNNENEQFKFRMKETNRQMKLISTDYCNLITITMELVETLQQAIFGKTISNEYIDNVCARLGLVRVQEPILITRDTNRLEMDEPIIDKIDYGKIKRDVVNISINPRERALLLQALRWKLTKAKTDFKREKTLECYIGCDLLGCRTDIDQRSKIIQQLSSAIGGDTYYVKEEWARLINTIASLRKGRKYLTPNESLILAMQKVAVAEGSDTLIKQHLLAALQKLSLRRSVQTSMINNNIIKWLIPLLGKTDRLSDYTLEYGVALLMNLCLRTNGRKKCAEIAEQAITVLSSLLTHPNQETRPYVNSSLYSILTLKSIRDKALQLNLDNRLRTLIRIEKSNSETKGQLEFLLNLLCKGGDQDGRQTSDNEQDNDDEDQDIMEADLDLGDKLRPTNKELSGEKLINEQYISQKPIAYSRMSYHSPSSNLISSSPMEPVLHRPTTPGQRRQSITAQKIDTLANNLTIDNIQRTKSDGFENTLNPPLSSKKQKKRSTSTDDSSSTSNSSASIHSSIEDLTDKNIETNS